MGEIPPEDLANIEAETKIRPDLKLELKLELKKE